jgi:hypothetical protein
MKVDIVVPQNWSAITLKNYLDFQKDVKIYGEEESGYVACLFHHLCKVEPQHLMQLPTTLLNQIKEDLVQFVGDTEHPLQRIIKVDGVDYGFEPNLSQIAYGAYLDLTKYDTITIDENWSKVMSILYRPVKSRSGALYTIEPYNGEYREEVFEKVGMDVHFGALHFFFHLSKDLVSDILNSLRTVESQLNTNLTLGESGNLISQLLNLQETIY